MFKVGDLVMHVPYREGVVGSWVMFGEMGIVIGPVQYNERGKIIYRIKWLDTWKDSFVPEDFLQKVEIK